MNYQLVLSEIVFIGLYLPLCTNDNDNIIIIIIIITKCIFSWSPVALSVAEYLVVSCTGSTLGLGKGPG